MDTWIEMAGQDGTGQANRMAQTAWFTRRNASEHDGGTNEEDSSAVNGGDSELERNVCCSERCCNERKFGPLA